MAYKNSLLFRVPDSKSLFKETVDVSPNGRRRPLANHRYCKCEEKSSKSTVVCNYHFDQQNCEQEEEVNNAIDKTNDIMYRSRHRKKRSEIYVDQGMNDYFDSSFAYNKEFKGQVCMRTRLQYDDDDNFNLIKWFRTVFLIIIVVLWLVFYTLQCMIKDSLLFIFIKL